jgi:hypothetical protein
MQSGRSQSLKFSPFHFLTGILVLIAALLGISTALTLLLVH